MTEGGGGMETTLVTARWSLVQFSLLAVYTLGFHGVTSFPYYIHKHSGLFLVAFYVLMVLVCIPVVYVQIKLGAIFKRGIVQIFSIILPVLKGVAVSILVLTYIRCLLHAVELSYALYFAIASLKGLFPWAATPANDSSLKLYHGPADKYFHEDFLQRSEHIGQGGYVVWYIAICLLATWTATCLLTFKGTALLSKIAYGLTTTTLLLLTVVLVYGYSTIPDASGAVGRLLNSHGEEFRHGEKPALPAEEDSLQKLLDDVVNYRLGHPEPWIDALNLHVNSLGLWSGVLPTLGTLVYNRKLVINASWILLLLVYSILPQVALFALAPYIDPRDSTGFISANNGIKPGLPFLFIAIPATLDRLELSPFIGFCLFICIFLFGLHHQALHLLAIWENLLPCTPKFLMSYFRRREVLVAAACGVSFLLCVPYAIQGGIHLYAVVNSYVDRLVFTLIIISTLPFILGYIKQEVLYIPIERAFMSLWYGLAALISSVLLIYYFAVHVYPVPVVGYGQRWAEALGWAVAVIPVLAGLGLGAVHAVYSQKGTLKQRLAQSLRSESFNTCDDSNDYTGETGETSLQTPHSHMTGEPVYEKTETEVFVQPMEDAEDPECV
ncbi:sodium- and chloride-dependent neutral and basic amino acid transporter B(0+)-like [Mya arenaria]|uniref:sodium- and chloride-dependent neutral and basic amino acid transporter B(0+)-like n=1 Tax=Mya arenaria TaxID=6604 RepID=UPI0022E945F2|nr:sodium- and chloride-dependent neutral and basic amino acid transporter B(0+)-like [Mya arenaria]